MMVGRTSLWRVIRPRVCTTTTWEEKCLKRSECAPALAYNEDGPRASRYGRRLQPIFDGDGLLDIFKTNFADDTHTMYRNRGANNFEDDTIGSGLAVNTKYLGWGTAFLDFDNDGWKDLIVANGHVYPEVDTGPQPPKSTSSRGFSTGNRGDGQLF